MLTLTINGIIERVFIRLRAALKRLGGGERSAGGRLLAELLTPVIGYRSRAFIMSRRASSRVAPWVMSFEIIGS